MAASASASFTAAPSDTSSSGNFQLFLNHRGIDVKKTFASHLYHSLTSHGFRVFLDKSEMKVGEEIYPQIRRAIATASVHIAIFSVRYAQSKWCLKELELMLDSMDKRDTTIIPVFYDVSPSDLRWTREENKVYGPALCNLEEEKRYQPNIPIWKEALSRVSKISGFELKECNGDEGELLDRVVQRVEEIIIREIPPLYVAAYPTGLDKKLEDFQKTVLLHQQQHSESTKVFGIVGPCGVGKTTLAKEFFNRNKLGYDRSCVLEDVRDNSLISMQNKLQQDLRPLTRNIHDGIEKNCRALVILDDVDNGERLLVLLSTATDVLGSNGYETLILVTSRNKEALTRSGIGEASIYKLKGLDREQSEQLFCLHAFHKPNYPAAEFEKVVNDFLDISDGLPLSLQVLGAQLFKKQLGYWESQWRKISGSVLPAVIQSRLKIGYDDLDDQEKEVFLDTACFFIKQDKDTAVQVWNASGWAGRVNLENLENKFLLEIDSKNCIKMHVHCRDLGRVLAEKELPRFHRRIWRPTDKLFFNASLQPVVRGINRVQGKSDQLSYSHLEVDMRQLQLLRAEGDCLASISDLLKQSDLLWLYWDKCPYTSLPPWIPVRNSTVLRVVRCEPELRHDESEPPLMLEHNERLKRKTVFAMAATFDRRLKKSSTS